MRPHVCQQCGRTYMAKPTKDGRRFCSKRCYGDAKMLPTMEPRTCGQCGKTFVPNRHAFTTAAYQGAFCSVACSNQARRVGLKARYMEYMKVVTVTDKGCWLWPGSRDKGGHGYGVITDDEDRQVGAHRVSYETSVGPIPAGKYVMHRCDNPPCVNPAHLMLGTSAENMADRDAKGRQASGDRSGARLHPERLRRGETHPRAKLSEDDVRAIRHTYASGGVTQKALATRYGISQGAVLQIVTRYTWKHVE